MNADSVPDSCLTVIVPAFNEEETVLESVQSVLLQPFVRDVIVIDDASTDSTVKQLQSISDPRLVVISHERNQGKGAAIRTGVVHAEGPYIGIHDADLEYDPRDFERLLEPLVAGRADAVYGSRFLSGDARRVLFFWHSLGNRLLTTISNAATNLNLSDMETCYKVFRKETIKPIVIEESRFGFEPEITVKLAAAGARVYEVGISYQGRTYAEGKKIGWRDGFEALRCIAHYSTRERVRSTRQRKMLKGASSPPLRLSLESLGQAQNYCEWITDLIAPELTGPVLEIGAGSGNITSALVENGLQVTAVEPDGDSFQLLRNRFHSSQSVDLIQGTSRTVERDNAEGFNSAVMVNVLEHIQDDREELQHVSSLLNAGGSIVLWVPANELIYSRFDLSIGHFRRYTIKSLRATMEAAGLKVSRIQYVNGPGTLAWGLVAKVARLTPTSSSLTRLYDNSVIPLIRRVEARHRPAFGQSILAVGLVKARNESPIGAPPSNP